MAFVYAVKESKPVSVQLRMCHGKFFLDGKPYKTLNQLWDGEQGNVAD